MRGRKVGLVMVVMVEHVMGKARKATSYKSRLMVLDEKTSGHRDMW